VEKEIMKPGLTLIATAVVVSALPGCGRSDVSLGKVRGMVTLDGSPIPDVMVNFSPEEGGRPSSARTDSRGQYNLIYSTNSMGAVVGKHVVTLTSSREFTDEELADPNVTLRTSDLAKELANWSKQVEVTAGSNTIDLELTAK
jgi:hypothetical protein